MTAQRRVLFHVQHFLGMGHLVRAFALADALSDEFQVVIAAGGRPPAGIAIPSRVELEPLPPLGFDADRMLVSQQPGASVERVLALRRQRLLRLHDRLQPDIVLVELFPFGRKKLAGELLALLDRARSRPEPAFTVTSVRDLLVTGRHDQQRHDDRAAAIAERLLDLILVHSDPDFATLDQSFRPTTQPSVATAYTGFVRPSSPPQRSDAIAEGTVVVSAGGGWVGSKLMHAALDAAPTVARRTGLRTTLVTGPLAADNELRQLRHLASTRPMVDVVRSVPALAPVLATAAASVSQAGYNTVVDLLGAAVPSVLVPFGDDRENEQPRRAALLAAKGLAIVVPPAAAAGPALADAVGAALDRPVPEHRWHLDGASRTVAILSDAANARWRRAG